MRLTNGHLILVVLALFAFTGCGLSSIAKKDNTAASSSPETPVTQAIPPAKPAASEKADIPQASDPAKAEVTPPLTQTAPAPAASLPVTKGASAPAPAPLSTPAPIIKKDPNHFVITVAEKTPAHPNFGKGHHLGLVLDNVPGKSLVLKRGETYEFDVQTDPLHDVYFSTSPVGWGGGTVTDGIKGQFTYRGLIVVSPTVNTPEIIYYQCRNHSSMGGKVVVVNKSASTVEIDRLLAANTNAIPAVGTDIVNPGAQKNNTTEPAKQKIMLAELMLQSKSTKAAADAGDAGGEAARSALANANNKLQAARQELANGHNSQAQSLAEEALKLISGVTRAGSNEEAAKLHRGRYNEALETLKNFQESHKQTFERTVKKRGAAAAVDYDHGKVDGMVNDAHALTGKGQYEKATQLLVKSERLVTQAIKAMLNAQTIVYDLNFESPADEYEYERKRFVSYEELIPIAIEEKKPAEAVGKLMDTYVTKGRARKSEADAKAKAGNYPDAISLMLTATEEIQRALRLAGVSQ